MEVKRDILWRVYLSYLLVAVACVAIFGKAVYIQQVQGAHWRSMSDSLHLKLAEIEADRGTIYSEDGQMLSTSIPQFDIYLDFRVAALHEKNGRLFRENLDSLSICLADLFKDQSAGSYRNLLEQGYKSEDGYFLLKKKISFREYEELRTFPLFRLGRYKSGMIANERTIRLNPYQMLAFRTIGLARDSNKVGLEMSYDAFLRGRNGKQFVRKIAGGASVPVDDSYQVEPETGKDIVSTLDVFIQEVTENALMKMMVKNEAQTGCAIVMEVKTGKIKAIANLGKRSDGSYWEDFNYAITPTEPGSTFKLATLISLLEDHKVRLTDIVNIENGVWKINGQTVFDSEQRGEYDVTVKRAFEKSSNVGMAKLVWNNYGTTPRLFLKHLNKLGMDSLTGIDLVGERHPVIYHPGDKLWGPTTLPWMAFGYNLTVAPLRTATLYNAIANGGKMMQPYLVSAVRDEGVPVKTFEPKVTDEKICSDQTLRLVRECLEGVCTEGTAAKVMQGTPYRVAGKTGTALVANGTRGYADEIYQSSFAGYFPADNPQYTCVVVIVNKPKALMHHGADVAGTVFREIADRLYSTYIHAGKNGELQAVKDSSRFQYVGAKPDMMRITNDLGIHYTDSAGQEAGWVTLLRNGGRTLMQVKPVSENAMPDLKNRTLKDALAVCEQMGLRVDIKGTGRVTDQSIAAGAPVARGQKLTMALNPVN